jgi:hypothetical protein
MRILCIISTHKNEIRFKENILILNNFLKTTNTEVDFAGISNLNDFSVYEDIITFKYKYISQSLQLSKICEFINLHKDTFSYDWYIKFRPDLKLLENPFQIDALCPNSINARARKYSGNKILKYGMSTGGEGCWKNDISCSYSDNQEEMILDDMLYIFPHMVIKNGAFDTFKFSEVKKTFTKMFGVDYDYKEEWYNKLESLKTLEHEWFHSHLWNTRGIKLNVIAIDFINMKHNGRSGHINC